MTNKFFGTGEAVHHPLRKIGIIIAIKGMAAAAVGVSIGIWMEVVIFNGAHLVSVIWERSQG